MTSLPWRLKTPAPVLTVVTMHLYMFENEVSHNLQFNMARPSWYISVHDGRHNVLDMYTDCPSNGLHLQHEGLHLARREALGASLALAIKLYFIKKKLSSKPLNNKQQIIF